MCASLLGKHFIQKRLPKFICKCESNHCFSSQQVLQLPHGAPLSSAVPAASTGRGSLTADTCSFLLLASSCRDGQQPHAWQPCPHSRMHGPDTSVCRPGATAKTAALRGHIQHRLNPRQSHPHALSRAEVLCRSCVVTVQAAAGPLEERGQQLVHRALVAGGARAGAAAQVPAWLQLFSLCKGKIAGAEVRHGARLDPLLPLRVPASPPFCCRSS